MKGITLQEKEYISYKHLFLDVDAKSAIYLGYPMEITQTEYGVLYALVSKPRAPLSPEEICRISSLNLSKENVSFHVSRINAKAKCIGNRALIKNMSKTGYFLNEEM